MKYGYLLLFLLLPGAISAQYEGYSHFDKGMFTDKKRYKKLKAAAVMNPFLEFRVDTALAHWGLIVEKIGIRSHPEGFQEAIFFKQPIPDVKCSFALIVFDKDGHYKHAQDFDRNANEYKQYPQMTYVDYAPQQGDVVLVKFIKATNIPPAKFSDAFPRPELNAEWVKFPVPEKADQLDIAPPMLDDRESTPISPAPTKPVIPKNLKTGKPQYFRTEGRLSGYVLNDSILIPFEYEELDRKYSDYMLAKRGGLWGAINKKGEAVLPFGFNDLRTSLKGTFLAQKSGNYGLISPDNKTLIPFEFRSIIPGQVVFIDNTGKELPTK